MKNIARGRGGGIFDPKTGVTYGELAALIYNTAQAVTKENQANVQPVAENKFETRGTYEIKDDKVVFNFELVNHYKETKELMFGSGQQFELTITDEKRQRSIQIFRRQILYTGSDNENNQSG